MSFIEVILNYVKYTLFNYRVFAKINAICRIGKRNNRGGCEMLKANSIKKAIASSVVALAILFTAVPALSQTVYADENDPNQQQTSESTTESSTESTETSETSAETSETSAETSETSAETSVEETAAPVVGLEDLSDTVSQEGNSDYIWFGRNDGNTYFGSHNTLNVRGRFGDNYIKSTYSEDGYYTFLRVGENVYEVELNELGEVYEFGGVQIRIVAGIDDSGKAVTITYTVYNNTGVEQNVSVGSAADVMIGANDSARVSYTSNGILMEDNRTSSSTYGASLRLMPGNCEFTTRWFGNFYNSRSNVFNNQEDATPYNSDSGIAWSWNFNMAAGETVERTARIGLYEDSYHVYYDANGGAGEMTDINSPYGAGLTATAMDNAFYAPEGTEFYSWNTAPDGSGVTIFPGSTFTPAGDTILYAQWVDTTGVYVYTEGENGEWTQYSNNGLSFRASRQGSDGLTFSRFLGVQVDGQDIGPDRFTAVAGSVVVTLKPDYLQSLAPGQHTVTLTFRDGAPITTNFTIKASAVPATGETMSYLPVIGVITLAAAGAVVLTKRIKEEEI